MVLAAYLKRYDIRHFIETGTHLGDTLAYLAHRRGVNTTSIELDEAYYRAAKQRFARYRNVAVSQGDSGNLLPELVRVLHTPALFWLDGHYSGGNRARASWKPQ